MDDFDKAVLCSFDPTASEEAKVKAIEYCAQVKSAPTGWIFCLEKFFTSQVLEIKFFCLVVLQEVILHRHNALSSKEQANLRESLFRWLKEFLPQHDVSIALKNKFAQTVALLFKIEYPQEWTSFFPDLFSLMQLGPKLIDMFLRIMKSIDEEVISKDVQRSVVEVATSNEIKDYIRDHHVQELANTWYGILDRYHASYPDLCKESLDNIGRYINWIDISLFANDKYVGVFYKFLSYEALRENACDCLYELVSKGMPDPTAKIALIESLKLAQMLSGINMDDDAEFLDSVGQLVNTTGTELISAIEKVQVLVQQQRASPDVLVKAFALLEDALVFLFKFLNHDDNDVSIGVVGFANAYLNSLKGVSLTPKHTEHLVLLLQIIRNKAKYALSFDFDKADEEEAEFANYRKELGNIFKGVTKLSSQITANFVHSTIESVTKNLEKASFADVEVSLYLLQLMGDGAAGSTLTELEPFFSQEIVLLAASNLSTYPHQLVTLSYFDTIVRYSRYLPDQPEVYKNILISFLDGRGIRHPHQTLRSRAAYLLSRFVKSQIAGTAPFLGSILQSLAEFLTVSFEVRKVFSIEDQLYLFEAAGALIGAQSADTQPKYIGEIVTPLTKQMEEILQKELYKSDPPEQPVYTTFLIQIITAIGTFSKGFNGQPAWIFKQALDMIMKVLQVLPNNDEVRAKVIFYMHRMISCMGADVLEYLPLVVTHLLAYSGVKDLPAFIALLGQFMTKFREQMFAVMDSILMQLIGRLFKFISELSISPPNLPAPTSEAERETLEVQKQYYTLIAAILSSNLTGVLTSPKNASHLNEILNTILQGCTEYRDSAIPKQCYGILKKLIEQWGGSDPGFNKFIYESIAPLLIKEPFKPQFDLSDGHFNLVVQEIVSLQKIILEKCGKEFLEYLKTILLPSLQCPLSVTEEYIRALETAPLKDFKTFFTKFVGSFKKKT